MKIQKSGNLAIHAKASPLPKRYNKITSWSRGRGIVGGPPSTPCSSWFF